MVMFAPHITDWCVIDMAFHLYRDDAEEPMSQECARDEMEAGEQATQVNCGITNTGPLAFTTPNNHPLIFFSFFCFKIGKDF